MTQPHHQPATIDRFAQARATLDRATSTGTLLGASLAVRQHGQLILQHHAGLSSRQPQRPVDDTTQWLVASITKPVAATAIMLLVQRGLLSLDQPVAELLPPFGANEKHQITIRHLLTHTSGLDESFRARLAPGQFGSEAALASLCETGLVWPVGTRTAYNNTGYGLLASIIERTAGEPFQVFIQRELLAPLNLTGTVLRASPEHLADRLAHVDDADPAIVRMLIETGSLAGGLISTAQDIATFGQLFLDQGRTTDHRLLSPAAIGAMLRDHTAGLAEHQSDGTWAPAAARGLAWRLNLRLPSSFCDLASPAAFGHGGVTGALLVVDPTYDLVIALMTNRWGWGGPARARIINAVYGAVGG